MNTKLFRMVYLVCFLLILTISTQPSQATSQMDLLNDIWPKTGILATTTLDYIDIKQVIPQGTTIEITVTGSLIGINSAAYFLVLLNDDGKPAGFEAAIMLSVSKDGVENVLWTINDPLIDISGWTFDPTGRHSSIDRKVISIHFPEYSAIISSNPVVASFTMFGHTDPYIDWTPNTYDASFFYSIFPKIIQKLPPVIYHLPSPPSSSPPPPTTTTTQPTTTTTTPRETSSTPTRTGGAAWEQMLLPTVTVGGAAVAGTAALGYSVRILRKRGK